MLPKNHFTLFMKWLNKNWPILVALFIALLIRLPHFGQIPAGLNRDEAALGYTAWSLISSGTDEYGKSWPILFTSFGDEKLPGYIYSLLPFVKIWGFENWVIRLPSLLSGLANIVLVVLIAHAVSQSWGWKEKQAKWFAGIAAILMAISPWGLHFSRVAYEAHLASTGLLIGIAAWLPLLIDNKNASKKLWWIGALGWSLAIFSYHSAHVFAPIMILFFAGHSFSHWKSFFQKPLHYTHFLVTGSIFTITIALLFMGGVWQANTRKQSGISPFASTSIERQYVAVRQTFTNPNSLTSKIIANRWTELTGTFASNLIRAINPAAIFVPTNAHGVHNPPGISVQHLWVTPFVLIGIGWIVNNRAKLSSKVLIAWLLAALVAPSLTIAPSHTVRLIPLWPALELMAALGITVSIWQVKGQRKNVFIAIIAILAAATTTRLSINYNRVAPQQMAQDDDRRYHALATTLQKWSAESKEVFTHSPEQSPYIWYLLENPIAGRELVNRSARYPTDAEGFRHMARIDNIYFSAFDWDNLLKNHNSIIVADPREIPDDKRQGLELALLDTLHDPLTGEVWYEIWRIN